jgi:RsiW-degrading membrane proteinase PrsW (M82 family)
MAFVVEEGLEQGRVIPLPVGRGALGADPRYAHVVLRDPQLAPRHLMVDVQPDGQITVWPDGGPVSVDDVPIDGAVRVSPGSHVRIGQTTLRLRAATPPGAGAPARASRVAKPKKSSAGLVAGWIVMGLIGVVILVGVFGSFGAQAAVSVLAAVLPAPLLVAIVLLIDRYEPEPKRVLSITYLYGATAAVVFAALLNTIVSAALGLDVAEFLEVSVVAPLVEETLKCLAVLAVFWRLRDQFNGVVDAVVYSAMVGLGFAVTENIFYYGAAFVEGSDVFAQTVVVRGVFSPFAHPLFTSMFGIGLAVASETARARLLWPILGWLGAMFLHGLWNAAASTGPGFLLAYVVVFVPVFLIVLLAAFLASRREQRLIRTHLDEDVTNGLLSRDELENLASTRGRRTAERESARRGGVTAKDRRREFHAAATRLAFLRHRRRSGALYAATAEEEARQVEEVWRAKAAATG